MSKEVTGNTFVEGMIMDSNDLMSRKTTLTNALNATLSTFNGNEYVLQNDLGNITIKNKSGNKAELTKGYIPIGVAEEGGIMYIASYNPSNNLCELGSFPSPNYEQTSGELDLSYQPLHNVINLQDKIFRTKYLNFNLEHPLEIITQKSYDGSINLVFTDNKNIQRLINTGFAVYENNTYKIIDRYGENNTNIYDLSDESIFNLQTSLIKRTLNISKFEFLGLENAGQLMVGQYSFYATVCDKDGNESDFICESGIIPVFHGIDGDPFTINGGMGNERSDKSIKLKIENIDSAYDYVQLYYSRTTSADKYEAITQYYKIDLKFEVIHETTDSGTIHYANIIVTGYEATVEITQEEINPQYFNADTVKTQSEVSNILFIGNVQSSEIKHEDLQKLSLNIYPIITNEKDEINKINSDYIEEHPKELIEEYSGYFKGYYSSRNVYNYVGYHNEEFYRFGIVYILEDNSLTPVYNILGVNNLTENGYYFPTIPTTLSNTNFFFNNDGSFVEYKESEFNIKGVSRINCSNIDFQSVIGIKININNLEDTINGLKAAGVKGYFIVRQKRIPTILGLGYVTNVAEEAFIPTLNYNGIDETSSLVDTYCVETFCDATLQGNSTDPNYLNLNKITQSLYYSNDFSESQESTSVLFLSDNYKNRILPLTKLMLVFVNSKGYKFAYHESDKYKCKVNKMFNSIYDDGDDRRNLPFEYKEEIIKGIETSLVGAKRVSDMDGYIVFAKPVSENPLEIYIKEETSEGSPEKYLLFRTVTLSNLLFNALEKYHGEYLTYYNTIYDKYYNYLPRNKDGGVTFYLKNSSGFTGYTIPERKSDEPDEKLVNFVNAIYLFIGAVRNNNYITFYPAINLYQGFAPSGGKVGLIEYFNTQASLNSDLPTSNGSYDLDHDVVQSGLLKNSFACFSPDFELNLPYYNNLYTGNNIPIKKFTNTKKLKRTTNERRYWVEKQDSNKFNIVNDSKIIAVSDGVSLVAINKNSDDTKLSYTENIYRDSVYFSAKVGNEADSSFKYAGAKFVGKLYKKSEEGKSTYPIESYSSSTAKITVDKDMPCNTVRGVFGPYLGIYNTTKYIIPDPDNPSEKIPDPSTEIADSIINIYIPNYSTDQLENYFTIRFDDETSYQSISDRLELTSESIDCYRGDCFSGWFTHRLNRNFQDASAPNNDLIVSQHSWAYALWGKNAGASNTPCAEMSTFRILDVANKGFTDNFNLGDVNAVKLGSWITFPCRTSHNICIRSMDLSYPTENLQMGNNGRPFYPLNAINAGGNYKVPESDFFNKGFNKSGNDRNYFKIDIDTYLNQYYKNRIYYSNIQVNTGIQNGTRSFKSTHFRDYCLEYGSITKLVSLNGYLICIFEHGIITLNVGDKQLIAEELSSNVYLNTNNVLPEYPTLILSDTFGTTYGESVVLSPYYIYGIDVTSKKIWRTDGRSFNIISDFSVLKFLNDHLTSIDVSLGTANIKSHYNRFKGDIMFTIYDYKQDIFWNLCWNEHIRNEGNWITFYSWIPSYTANLGNTMISLDVRDSNKILGKSNEEQYLWKHGLSLFIKTNERIYPTNWYGEPLPFEFEFIVADKPSQHKIFTNFEIISNNAEPESFHYEIVGDCFNFAEDKLNMFVRLELLKALYSLTNKMPITYDERVKLLYDKCVLLKKSALFPLYYIRWDKPNIIEDYYYRYANETSHDYRYLSGTELVYYLDMDEFRICQHSQAIDVTKSNLFLGNMRYLEDKWNVQIQPINIVYKNEYYRREDGKGIDFSRSEWGENKLVPLSLCNLPIPSEINTIGETDWTKFIAEFPLYNAGIISQYITDNNWNSFKSPNKDYDREVSSISREQIKVKDKYMKIKVRYSGDKLALINAINTYYILSYA